MSWMIQTDEVEKDNIPFLFLCQWILHQLTKSTLSFDLIKNDTPWSKVCTLNCPINCEQYMINSSVFFTLLRSFKIAFKYNMQLLVVEKCLISKCLLEKLLFFYLKTNLETILKN